MLVCVALSGQNVLLPWKLGALPQADLPRSVGPNHSGLAPQAGSTPPESAISIFRAARNESGERSGVSPPIPRFCTGKLTHAARQFPHS